MEIPTLPLTDWISASIRWMQFNLEGLFAPIKGAITALDALLRGALYAVPFPALIAAVAIYLVWRRRYGAAFVAAIGLSLIVNLGLWRATLDTVALMVIASGLAILAGVPVGILIAENRVAKAVIVPALDYMQTTPAFVYLIPAVLFFGIGAVPGVLATAAFALPPVARTLALGLEQVNPSLVEVGLSFGASRFQILWRIKLPLSRAYLRVGINQCIMMGLSMVVVCSLIGARGLGVEVITALAQLNLGKGIESGVAVVLLAMVLDRLIEPEERRRPGRRGAAKGRPLSAPPNARAAPLGAHEEENASL